MRFAHLQSRITEILKDVFEAERTEDIVTIMQIFKNLVEMGKFFERHNYTISLKKNR